MVTPALNIARALTVLGACLLVIGLAAGPARGATPWPVPVEVPSWLYESRLLSGEDRESADPSVLLGKGKRWHLMTFDAAADTHQLDAKLAAYGELAYIPRDPIGAGPMREEIAEPTALGLKGELGDFEGGVEYQSAASNSIASCGGGRPGRKDREDTEVRLARTLGVLRLRLAQSDLSGS